LDATSYFDVQPCKQNPIAKNRAANMPRDECFKADGLPRFFASEQLSPFKALIAKQ
jgi:hypothetical protein